MPEILTEKSTFAFSSFCVSQSAHHIPIINFFPQSANVWYTQPLIMA